MSTFRPREPIYLKGPFSHLPAKTVDNEAIIKWMGAKIRSSWIEKRTGIKSRQWVENESCSDLALAAAEKLLVARPELRSKIRQVILGTVSGDFISPPTSPLLQEKLGLTDCGAFDVGAACAGFVTGLHVGGSLAFSTGETQLLICSEIRSKYLSPKDFATAVLFGDGSAAVGIDTDPKGADFKLLGTKLASDGSVFDLISIPAGGSKRPFTSETDPEEAFLKMHDGASIFLKAVHAMTELPRQLLTELGIREEDLAWIVPHQANLLLINEIEKRFLGPTGRTIETVSRTGNTSGASVGIALDALRSRPELKKGDRILLASAGGGGLAACAVLERC